MAESDSSSFAILPKDLVTRIFLLLPVVCLLRVKSVCKSWLSLIESSCFIHQHIDRSHSEDNEENKLIVFNLKDTYPFKAEHGYISVMDFQLSRNVDFKLNTNEMISSMSVDLIGCFDGIVCLKHGLHVSEVIQVGIVRNGEKDPIHFDFTTVVSLWNPATKHVKILPPPLVHDSALTYDGEYRIDYGFGFDAKNNDYRVVRIIVAEIKDDSNLLKSHVQVYSLNTDSWRVIDVVVPVKIWITSGPKRPFGNGICCWFGRDFISKEPIILTFDFSNEVFGVIPLFDDYEDSKLFTFLNEKLACIRWGTDPPEEYEEYMEFEEYGGDCPCEIWVLDKCGEKESWTNLYTIVLEPRVYPVGFTVNGKMVLKKKKYDGKVKMYLLDLTTQEMSRVPYLGTVSEVAVYQESLVSVKGANGVTYRVDSKWKPISSTWDRMLSQWVMASSDNFAAILDEDASSLLVFDEPKTVPRLPNQSILPTHWSPPLAGTIKLNTDAILHPSNGLGTFGFVARTSAGVAVKAVCSNPLPMSSITTAKTEAIKNALSDALTAGWDSVIVETDCKLVVDTIKGCIIKGSSNCSSSFSPNAGAVGTLSTRFRSISFCSVPRNLNTAAQILACHGFKCNAPCVWDDAMPDWLSDVLAKDLAGYKMCSVKS